MAARLTAEQRRLRLVTEAQWQSRVTDLATLRGWKWFHPASNIPVVSRTGARYIQNIRAGFPDLTLARGNRLVFAELKKMLEKTTEEQDQWLEALRMAGAACYVWRPSDWDEVRRILD